MVTRVAVHYLPASAADANRLAACLAVPTHEISMHTFPDGELRVTPSVEQAAIARNLRTTPENIRVLLAI